MPENYIPISVCSRFDRLIGCSSCEEFSEKRFYESFSLDEKYEEMVREIREYLQLNRKELSLFNRKKNLIRILLFREDGFEMIFRIQFGSRHVKFSTVGFGIFSCPVHLDRVDRISSLSYKLGFQELKDLEYNSLAGMRTIINVSEEPPKKANIIGRIQWYSFARSNI